MSQHRKLYRAEQLQVFHNQMFRNPVDAIHCTKGDIPLLHTLRKELIHNGAYYHERAIILGSALKRLIFDLFMQWDGANIDYIINIDPAKQEKHLTGPACRFLLRMRWSQGCRPGRIFA
jgi:hypothetical protein